MVSSTRRPCPPEGDLDNRTAIASQLFFPEDFSDAVYALAPYSDQGERDTRIDTGDMVYSQADAEGTPLLLTLRQQGDEVVAAGNIVIAT